MKKTLVIFAVCAITTFFASTSWAHAETKNVVSPNDNSAKTGEGVLAPTKRPLLKPAVGVKTLNARPAVKAAVKEIKKTEIKKEIEKNVEKENNNGEKNGQKAINLQNRAENAVKELNALYTRFSKIADRIDARIAELTAKNVNTDAAKKDVAAARASLAQAKTDIDNIGTTFTTEASAAVKSNLAASADALMSTTTPANPAAFKGTRALIEKAKRELIAAHKNLMQALKDLKPLPGEPKPVKGEDAKDTNPVQSVQPVQ